MDEEDLQKVLAESHRLSDQMDLFDRISSFVYGMCGVVSYPLTGGYYALQKEIARARFPENFEHYRISLDETNECIVSAFESMREGDYTPILRNPLENIIKI